MPPPNSRLNRLSTMHRVMVQKVDENRVVLPEEEAHHLVRVLRARPGETFLGLDGMGKLYLCRLEREPEQWVGRVVKEVVEERESPLKVILAQTIGKKDRFEWVIQKAVELGAAEIVPLISYHSKVKLNQERAERRVQRWRKIVLEAVKQSRRSRIPKLTCPVLLSEFVSKAPGSFRFVLDEAGGSDLKGLINRYRHADSCLVFVGPEGGWDERDRKRFQEHQIPAASLGPRILRTETAPVAVLSILQYELGDLGKYEVRLSNDE